MLMLGCSLSSTKKNLKPPKKESIKFMPKCIFSVSTMKWVYGMKVMMMYMFLEDEFYLYDLYCSEEKYRKQYSSCQTAQHFFFFFCISGKGCLGRNISIWEKKRKKRVRIIPCRYASSEFRYKFFFNEWERKGFKRKGIGLTA